MPQRPKTHQRPPHHLWTGDTSANSTPSLDEGLHGQLLRTQLPPDGIANDPTVGAVNKIFSINWPQAHFVLNVHHWSIQRNFRAEVSHVKRDNNYADELSRRESMSELIRRGWNAEKQLQGSFRKSSVHPAKNCVRQGSRAGTASACRVHLLARRAEPVTARGTA